MILFLHLPSMIKVTIVNGPNLNLLGKRENEIYGNQSFEDYFSELRQHFPIFDLTYFQSNVEGEIIDLIQEAGSKSQALLLNAAGYTHTSVAIGDAVAALSIPCIEVHISNILKRESFRHQSYVSPYAKGVIFGFGLHSYHLGLQYLEHYFKSEF